MISKFTISTLVIAWAVALGACGGETATNTAVAVNTSNAANGNAAKSNVNNPLGVTTPTPAQTTNNAPTLTPVYKAYCAAMVKRDEAALRKIYSRDTIKYFEGEMKADNIKTLTEFLSDDQVTNDLCEVRNEQINGDTAVAEIRSKGYPNGIKVVFVKEDNEWKLTNRSPEVPAK
jgi:hypothetical protein